MQTYKFSINLVLKNWGMAGFLNAEGYRRITSFFCIKGLEMRTCTNTFTFLGSHWWWNCFSLTPLSFSLGESQEVSFSLRYKSLFSSTFPAILNHILLLDLFILYWSSLQGRDEYDELNFLSTISVNPKERRNDYYAYYGKNITLILEKRNSVAKQHFQHSCEGLLHHAHWLLSVRKLVQFLP